MHKLICAFLSAKPKRPQKAAAGQEVVLYGLPRPITASTSHSFGSLLNSLLATTSGGNLAGSTRTKSTEARKDDIFATHNKESKKGLRLT